MARKPTPKPANKVAVMAFIPPELLKRLDAIARQEECSRSRVLALAARAYVEAKAA